MNDKKETEGYAKLDGLLFTTLRQLKESNGNFQGITPIGNKMKFGMIKEPIHPQHKLKLSMDNSNPE